jgi:hypothetical protein
MINDSAMEYNRKMRALVATNRKPKQSQVTEPTGIALFQALELQARCGTKAAWHGRD